MTIWRRIKKSVSTLLGTIIGVIVLVLLIVIVPGYYNEWQWTGLPATEKFGPKTLWDWLDLLIIPAVLGFGALWFRKTEAIAERQRAERNAKLERDLENQRAQEAALEAYLDRMSTLLLDKELGESEASSPVQDLARTRTITMLRRSDVDRRNLVFNFLRAAKLLGEEEKFYFGLKKHPTEPKQSEKKVALLSKAKMEKMDLRGADLRGADLRGANLEGADLREADLKEAKLKGADLSRADLIGARLYNADLRGADLSGANLILATLILATLDGANLDGADLRWADPRKRFFFAHAYRDKYYGVNCRQLKKAKNWESTLRDWKLACGASIPELPKEWCGLDRYTTLR